MRRSTATLADYLPITTSHPIKSLGGTHVKTSQSHSAKKTYAKPTLSNRGEIGQVTMQICKEPGAGDSFILIGIGSTVTCSS